MTQDTFIEHEDVIKKILRGIWVCGSWSPDQGLTPTYRCVICKDEQPGGIADDYIKGPDQFAAAHFR